MNDLEILKTLTESLNSALIQAYQVENLASIPLESKIEKAIEEANELIDMLNEEGVN